MDAGGKVLAKQGERTVAGFEKSHRALATLAELDKPNLMRDGPVKAAVFIAKLQLGKFSLGSAGTRRGPLSLDKAQQKIYDQEIVNLTVSDHYDKARQNRDYTGIGPKFVVMKNAGRIPTGIYSRNFWSQIMLHAKKERDAKLYEESYREYKNILGDDKRYQRIFDRYDATLEALKNGEPVPGSQRRAAVRSRRAAGAAKVERIKHR